MCLLDDEITTRHEPTIEGNDMKTPEQVAQDVVNKIYAAHGSRFGGSDDPATKLDRESYVGQMDGDMILGLMAEAIEADRAQR